MTPGDLRDHVVQALEVLDVQGGVDADARGEQLLDVLPALGVARAGRVGVGQLVHEDHAGRALQRGVEIELLQGDAAVLQPAARQHRQPFQQRGRLRAAVGLDHAHDDLDALAGTGARRFQHRVRLPHAGGRAEEDLEAAARRPPFLLAYLREEGLRIGPAVGHAHKLTSGRRGG